MNADIYILDQNSYGFTKGPGEVDLTASGIVVKGVGLKAQTKTIQDCLQGIYIFVGLAVFIVIQWFIIIPHFGEVIKKWIEWFAEDPDLFNMIFQFLFLVVLPFAGAFWLSGKVVNPLRSRFSIPQKSFIPYEELTWFKLIGREKIELLAASKDNSDHRIIFTFQDIAIPLILFSKITSDYDKLSKLVGAEIDRKNNENVLKLKFFGREIYIKNNRIDGPEKHPYYTPTLIINYLSDSWFALKNNKTLVVGKNYVSMQTLFNEEDDHFHKRVKRVANEFEKNSTLMENVIVAMGGKLSSDVDDEKTYLLNALPNIPLLLEVEKKWPGKYTFKPLFEKNCYEFFGEEFIKEICVTFFDLFETVKEKKRK